MATLTLKVSIDDSKYVIRGIDKESSQKEILCIITKYKKKDQLPELRSALSRLNGSISILEVKASNNIQNPRKRNQTSSKNENKRKGRCKNIANAASHEISISGTTSFSNDEKNIGSFSKQQKTMKKGIPANDRVIRNTKCRKKPHRSHSLNENDKRQEKYRLRQRPKSFGAFDAAKILKLDHSVMLEMNQNIDIHSLLNLKKGSLEECSIDSGKEKENLSSIKTCINDSAILNKSKIQCALKPTKLNLQSKQKKLKDWLENLETNSIAYFIEETDAQNCSSNQKNCLSSAERKEEREESNYCSCEFAKEKGQRYMENIEYAEAETDSGLPSLDYESSLDTLSRDDRISIEQSYDEGRSKDAQNDSVFESSSWNEKKFDANTSHSGTERATEGYGCYETEEFQNTIIGRKNSATERHLCEGNDIEGTKVVRDQNRDTEHTSPKINEKAEDGLFAEVKFTIDKISKTDENILHCELLISQLEFQLDVLSENFDTIEDIEMEIEEMKLVSELKDTEEFLKAITKLSQYQREAQSEIIAEVLDVDTKMKERQMKLQSLERKLIRQKFKYIPRHLIVSREKKLYANQITSAVEIAANSEIFLCDNETNTISLV